MSFMQRSLPARIVGLAQNQFHTHRLVWSMATVAVVVSLAGVVLRLTYATTTGDMAGVLSHVALNPFLTIAYAIVGALVAARHPRNVIGWLFLAIGATYALNIGAAAAGDLTAILAGQRQLVRLPLVRWLDNWFWMPGVFLPTVFVFLLFPDGRLLSSRWRPVLWAAALGLGMTMLALALHPGPVESWGTAPNPYGIAGTAPLMDLLLAAGSAFLGIGFVGGIASFIVRYRRAQGLERKQMQWLLYAIVLLLVAHVLISFFWYSYPDSVLVADLAVVVSSLSVLGIALAAALAIFRHRLYDIDLLVRRTLVYGALTASVLVIYVLVVGGLGWLFQAQGNPVIGLLTTGLVAVLFQPLRERLQHAVDRLFYGQRDDPLDALAQLGARLEQAIAPDVVLSTLVETVAQTLRLPYVAIRLQTPQGAQVVTQFGNEVPGTLRLPLIYQGQTLGHLLAGPRATGETFSGGDRRLLAQIARQAGPAVQAVQLTAALQASRRQLVTAREEERRRLRRDLHDGLGAALAGLHLQTGVLRRLIDSDPQQAQVLVDEFRADVHTTIGEIRRLVYALRPPTLDQLGLAAAVRAEAAARTKATANGDAALRVRVEAPEELPALPAAVEVAALRIVQEALTNVVHHAGARHCWVRLQANGDLHVEVVDDGVGLVHRRDGRQGLGLTSMRERALELGGSFVIENAPGGGTRVLARIPLPQEGD